MRSGAQRLRGVQRAGDGGLVGDVGLREACAIAQFANRVFALEVQHDHLRPGIEQPPGGGQAQPRRASGDDGYGVFDLHANLSLSFDPAYSSGPIPSR